MTIGFTNHFIVLLTHIDINLSHTIKGFGERTSKHLL